MISLYGGLVLYTLATAFAIWSVRSGDRRGLQTARFAALFGAIDHTVYLVRIGIRRATSRDGRHRGMSSCRPPSS